MLRWGFALGILLIVGLLGIGLWLSDVLPMGELSTPTPTWNETEQRLIQLVDETLTLSPCDEGDEVYYQQQLESVARLLAAPDGKNMPLERLEAIWEAGFHSRHNWVQGPQPESRDLELFGSDGDAVLVAVWRYTCMHYGHGLGSVGLSVMDRSGDSDSIDRINDEWDVYNYATFVYNLTPQWMEDRWVALVNNNTQGLSADMYSVWHITQDHGKWRATVQFALEPGGNVFSCAGFEFSGFMDGYRRFTASFHCVTMVPPCEYKEGYRVYGNMQHITTTYEWTGEGYRATGETRVYTTVTITDRAAHEFGSLRFHDEGWRAYCRD